MLNKEMGGGCLRQVRLGHRMTDENQVKGIVRDRLGAEQKQNLAAQSSRKNWGLVVHATGQWNAYPALSPSLRKTVAAGQKPVTLAWIILRPAKAVSSSQYGL